MERITDFMAEPGAASIVDGLASGALVHAERKPRCRPRFGEGCPVGIFTERDVLLKLDFRDGSVGGTRLASVMSRPLLTAGPEISCGDALALMRDKGIRNLPIVSDGSVIGIVSLRSLLNHYSSHLERLLDGP